MAELSNSPLQNLRGTIGKQLVFKKYGDKTVISKYPSMKEIQPSEQQKESRRFFKEAVAFAQAINRNPEQKALYQQRVKTGESVYHYALKEYLTRHKR